MQVRTVNLLGRLAEKGLLAPGTPIDTDVVSRRGGKGHPLYLQVVEERKALHIEKSGGYGTTADPFANFTAVAEVTGQPRFVYPVHRAIEKLTRCASLIDQGRYDELGEEFMDVSSLLDCAEAMRREDKDAATSQEARPASQAPCT